MEGMVSLISLPTDTLLSLVDHLHNIEDYTSLSSTCTTLRSVLSLVSPNRILRLAALQPRIFSNPSHDFLVIATARELGNWARLSVANESALAAAMQLGIGGLFDLALQHCGLTLSRVRELYDMSCTIINPVSDIIDQCVGEQWRSTPNFQDVVNDAASIDADIGTTFSQLVIYGELFGPDLISYLDGPNAVSATPHHALTVDTRLEYIKYCIPDPTYFRYRPDYIVFTSAKDDFHLEDGTVDPRRAIKRVGPYLHPDFNVRTAHNNNSAMGWLLKSPKWSPHWKEVRRKASAEDFQDDFVEPWMWGVEEGDWRQRLWEAVMVCQGLEGLGMIRPELQDNWLEKIREWRAKIAALEHEPKVVVTRKRVVTYDYPYLMGDVRICGAGLFSDSDLSDWYKQ